jgi:hypothetical protein
MPHSLVNAYQNFKETCCPELQDGRVSQQIQMVQGIRKEERRYQQYDRDMGPLLTYVLSIRKNKETLTIIGNV